MDLKDQIMQELGKVDTHIDQLEAKAEEQAKLNGKVQEELKTELTNSNNLYKEIKERLDTVEKESKRIGAGADAKKSWGEVVMGAVEDNRDKLKAMKEGETRATSFEIKQAITMTQGDSLTGEVIEPTRVPGFVHEPDRQVHVRQFLNTASTDSSGIRYVTEENYEDGTDITNEGSTKPKSSLELEAKDAPVRKIATHFKISDEMLEDVAGLSGHISTRGTMKYRLKEDQQLLYGTGTGNQIEGLTVAAADYSSVLDAPVNNEYDASVDAIAQLANREYMASSIWMNPVDWYNLAIRKDTQGRYVLPDLIRQGLAPRQIAGVPVIINTAIQPGDFLTANLAMMATLYDRRSVSVQFFNQNEDDAINNLITVVIEGRLALPVYLPNAGVYGDFDSVITS